MQVTFDQIQKSGLYRMPIEVRITTSRPGAAGGRGAGAATAMQTTRVSHIVQLNQQHQVFTLPSDVEPANVELDPDAWVMMLATFAKK